MLQTVCRLLGHNRLQPQGHHHVAMQGHAGSSSCTSLPALWHHPEFAASPLIRSGISQWVVWLAQQGEKGAEAAEAAVEAELRLTEGALRKNPKSYASWHQRKWLVQLGVVPLEGELALVTKCACFWNNFRLSSLAVLACSMAWRICLQQFRH